MEVDIVLEPHFKIAYGFVHQMKMMKFLEIVFLTV